MEINKINRDAPKRQGENEKRKKPKGKESTKKDGLDNPSENLNDQIEISALSEEASTENQDEVINKAKDLGNNLRKSIDIKV